MAEVQHGTLRPGAASGNHVIHDWEVADAAARLALTVSELQVGKVCRQLSDSTWWILARFTGGVVWKRIDVDAIPPALSNTMPAPLGAAAPGTANEASRGDHVHAHGDQGGGSLHPVATGLVAGFMSAAAFSEHQQLAAAGPSPAPGPAPANVTKAAAAPGIAATYSRSDHKHDVTTGAPVSIGDSAATNTEGTSSSLARADHVHALAAADRAKLDNATALSSTAPANVTKAAAAPGIATDAARSDHKHDIATAAPVSVGGSGAVNAEGSSTSLARADHVHALAAADRTKLDNSTALTATAPVNVTKATAVVGVATDAARADHKHDVTTAAPVSIGGTGASNTEGSSTSLARADHVHVLASADRTKLDAATAVTSTAPVNVTRATAIVGVATDAARADHKHDVTTAAPVSVGSSNIEGTSTSLARADHVHAGLQLTATAPANVTKAAAAPGVATDAARADHKHDVATAAPVTIGASNTEGTSTSLARADHVHDHGAQPIGTGNQHAVATTTVAGFMSGADKVALAAAAPKEFNVVNWSTTALTFAATHAGALILFVGSANATLTVPTDAQVNLPIGFTVSVFHDGFGGHITIAGLESMVSTPGYGADPSLGLAWRCNATFVKVGPDYWIVNGTFAATEAP